MVTTPISSTLDKSFRIYLRLAASSNMEEFSSSIMQRYFNLLLWNTIRDTKILRYDPNSLTYG
jgi:hypothetical protein